jgi:putative ABC transport system permease protein
MSIPLSAQVRKSLADVVQRRAHSAVIVLAILLPVAGLTTASVAGDSLSASYAFAVSRHGNKQDVVIAVDRSEPSLLRTIAQRPNVVAVQQATVLDTQWHVAAAPGHVAFRLVGYPEPRHVPLSPFQLLSGRYPGPGEIVMEYGDRGLQRFGLGDRVRVDTAHGTATLRVVGIARTPGANPAVTGIGIGYATAGTLAALPAFAYAAGPVQRQPFRSDEISLQLHDPGAYASTVHSLGAPFEANRVTVLAVFPPGQNAPVAQLQGILSLVRVLLAVALVLAAILVVSAVTALVAGQASVIGTMKALGATRARVVRGYATTVLLLALAATPLGVGLGILAGGRLASSMAASIPLAPGPTVVSAAAIGLGLAVGLALPLLAALLPLWLATRITVHEALSDWGVAGVESARPPRFTRAFSPRLARVPQSVWLGLRGLFRKPWRAGISIVAIAVAAASFLVVASLASSVNASIGSVWGSFHADVEVYVSGDTSYRQITHLLARVPNIRGIERVGWFGAQTAWGKAGVWGIEPTSTLHHADVTSGRWFRPGEDGVCLVSDDLAARAGLRVGSTITVPGPGNARNMRFTVIGTVHEAVDDLSQVGTIDMPVNDLYRLEGAPAARIGAYTNRVLIEAVDRSPAAVDRLTRAIDAIGRRAILAGKEGPIAGVFTFHDEVVRHQRNLLPVYLLLLAAALVIAALGGLGLADALTASVLERRREIGLLRSLGASGRRVAVVFWIEGTALSLTAWIAAAAIGVPLAPLFVGLFRRKVMPTDFHFAPLDLALTVAATLALAALATILPARRAAALRTADLLRTE